MLSCQNSVESQVGPWAAGKSTDSTVSWSGGIFPDSDKADLVIGPHPQRKAGKSNAMALMKDPFGLLSMKVHLHLRD